MDIRAATRADLESIARLHKATFQGLFAGDLSLPCVIAFYQALLGNPHGGVFIVQADGGFAGFIAGCASGAYASFGLKARMVFEMLKAGRLLEVLRAIRKAAHYRHFETAAELISIAVTQEHQRKGLGRRLLDALENHFRSQRVAHYFVFTDLERSRGLSFYTAQHFQEIRRVRLFGLEGVFLEKHLS